MGSISNITIEEFINKVKEDDLKKRIVGVFPSNNISLFINFHQLIKEKYASYPFTIILKWPFWSFMIMKNILLAGNVNINFSDFKANKNVQDFLNLLFGYNMIFWQINHHG